MHAHRDDAEVDDFAVGLRVVRFHEQLKMRRQPVGLCHLQQRSIFGSIAYGAGDV